MKTVYQQEIVKHENECIVQHLYMIMEWDHKYIVSFYNRVRGFSGCRDDGDNFVYPKPFDTVVEAHEAVVKFKQVNGDYGD